MVSVAFQAPIALRKPIALPFSSASSCCGLFVPTPQFRTRISSPVHPRFVHVSMTTSNTEPSPATSSSPEHVTQNRPSFKSLLENIKIVKVNPKTGKERKPWEWGPHEKIYKANLRLPDGPVAHLPVDTDRKAYSRVFGLKKVIDSDMSNAPFIVFGHGFLLRPNSYFSLLNYLAIQGYVIIAPKVRYPVFGKVETIGPDDNSNAKIQTAVLIDSARSFDVASDYGSEVHLFGHSMGGGMVLAFAEYAATAVQSVGLMAPEVGGLELTTLNKHIRLDEDDGVENMENLARNIKCRVMVMRSKGDGIVPEGDMEKLMTAFRSAPSVPLTGLLTLESGDHWGFDDVPFVFNIPTSFARQSYFGLKNAMFSSFIPSPFGRGKQLKSTKAIYKAWFKHTKEDENTLKEIMEDTKTASEGKFKWN